MKRTKIIAGIILGFMALTILVQAFKTTPPEFYEKLAAFFISGGLSLWLLHSATKKKE